MLPLCANDRQLFRKLRRDHTQTNACIDDLPGPALWRPY
jgi:hypothetical protein